MLNRRGFIGAMAGMPIAAVVQPKGPTVVPGSPAEVRARENLPPQITINIGNVRPLTARDRDALADLIGKSLTGSLRGPR